MVDHIHIVIGSKLDEALGNPGEYAVQFMGATLTFDNGSSAVAAYQNIEGEAYIWDVSRNNRAVLLEAKLFKEYFAE
ncbi:MAG: hypothetical protein ABIN36_17090 [Ferruginibacter sp.]